LIHTELRKKSVTLRLLWVEYREAHPDGYGYSQFCALYREWAQHLKPSLRLSHKGGEKAFVDYAGQTVPIVDPHTGEVQQAQIFIGVLGASNYTYAEAQESQELSNWIAAHVRMFACFGGVPEIVVPDNLKAGVKHPCRYEPDLNPTYQDLAQHYGTAVIPTRVRKPKDKAKAEVGVQVVERWILARLRNRTFFSLADLNQALRELLDELNTRPMKHLGRSRRELFEELDQPALKPLPQQPYEFAMWKKVRVNIDYHVAFDKHYYSVPHTLIHEEVYVRATQSTIEIFFNNRRIASHRRSNSRGRHTTLSEHMPPAHQKYLEWSPERFTRWAQSIGPHTAQVVQALLDSRKHPQQAYRFNVRYQRTSRLLHQTALSHADGSYPKLLDAFARVQLLVLDDWLRDPLTRLQSQDLLEILDDRYDRASTLVATQVPVAEWHARFPDPTIGDAILDRLVHSAYRLALEGESRRKIDSPLPMPTT